jgi:glutamyl-Q tRNA(Asp) synthetase
MQATTLSPHGRFAPSPTGPLHLGSLTTALASWLDARANGHHWYVRMEDIDAPREAPGAAQLILHQLKAHGLYWDRWPDADSDADGVLYQSQRSEAYQHALLALIRKGLAYPCGCSRKRLQIALEHGKTAQNPDGEILYPRYCTPPHIVPRPHGHADDYFAEHDSAGVAWRFFNANGDDFVIRRADGLWSYHLAVVVDDAHQGITDIIRGDDLLHAAPRHTALRAALGYLQPRLFHVPVVRNELGEKLSKQTKAPMIRTDHADRIRMQLECAWSHLQLTMNMRWLARVEAACDRLINQSGRGLGLAAEDGGHGLGRPANAG